MSATNASDAPEAGRAGARANGNGSGDPSSLPPGADRFWGEFSRTRAGRSNRSSGDGGSHGGPGSGQECLEWCPVCRSADLIRATAPPDVKSQLEAIQHEAFNVMRAFLSAYSEKTSGVWQGTTDRTPRPERDRPEEGGTDIPID